MGTGTWKQHITGEMEDHKDSWSNVVDCTLTELELATEFDGGYGGTEGKPFTVWTKSAYTSPLCMTGQSGQPL